MFKVDNLAEIIQQQFNAINESVQINVSITADLRKLYGDYPGELSNEYILGSLGEIDIVYNDINGVESGVGRYALEMLVPENLNEPAEAIFKILQNNSIGVLADTSFENYSIALTYGSYQDGEQITLSAGNFVKAVVYIMAKFDYNIVNGSDFTFTLKNVTDSTNVKSYTLDCININFGEIKNQRAGNFNSNGIIGIIPQSQSLAITATGVLKKNSFATDVILNPMFQTPDITEKWQLDIDGYDNISYSIPVVLSRPTLPFSPKTGVVWTLSMNYRS